MTLHEAIIKLLEKSGSQMSTQEIADALNENEWYEKHDGSKLTAFQIHGRTRNYPQYFDRDGGIVRLKGDLDKSEFHLKISSQNSRVEVNPESTNKEFTVLIDRLMNHDNFQNAGTIDDSVPDKPGLYVLRIKKTEHLSPPFEEIMTQKGHNIIYIGIASKSLHRRMLKQELRAKGHGTFFRSLGAMLGYEPPMGSLIHRKSKRNYKFSQTDKRYIIDWINTNLLVNWIEVFKGLNEIETELIRKYEPLLNTSKNPGAVPYLIELRRNCVEIANRK